MMDQALHKIARSEVPSLMYVCLKDILFWERETAGGWMLQATVLSGPPPMLTGAGLDVRISFSLSTNEVLYKTQPPPST